MKETLLLGIPQILENNFPGHTFSIENTGEKFENAEIWKVLVDEGSGSFTMTIGLFDFTDDVIIDNFVKVAGGAVARIEKEKK